MPRPTKQGCDYFSHDADMRNHRKVKAVRQKYQNGYAIWCMTLEYLTSSANNRFELSDVEIELIAGDFGFQTAEIRGVLDYCVTLGLLIEKDGFIYSETLNQRLAMVYQKRERNKSYSTQQHRDNGKYAVYNADDNKLQPSETPQSKVKESKVKESNSITTGLENLKPFSSEPLPFNPKIPEHVKTAFSETAWQEHVGINAHVRGGLPKMQMYVSEFLNNQVVTEGFQQKSVPELKSHFLNWVRKRARDEPKNGTVISYDKPIINGR